MAQKSIWRDGIAQHEYPALRTDLTVDVAIIGGGLTGLTAAYELRDSGLSVALLEANTLGAYASGSTTAFLMELIDTDADELVKTRGEREARAILDSHRDAVSLYESIVTNEAIDCEFARTPFFKYALSSAEATKLRGEVSALEDLGRDAMWQTTQFAFPTMGYMTLGNQAKFHPLKFLTALSGRVRTTAKIFEHTEVTSVSRTGNVVILKTSMHTVHARYVLMATHYPITQPKKLFFKKAAYITYVLAASIPKKTLPEGLYEDMLNPYHYMRVDKGAKRDRLIVGGEDHRMDVSVPEEPAFIKLRAYVHERLPNVKMDVEREWKGRIVEPGDGIAFLGPVDMPHLYYATGYSGNGLTYAAIAAQLFRDYVRGTHNPLQEIYAAGRQANMRAYLSSAGHYLEEFKNGALKHLFRR